MEFDMLGGTVRNEEQGTAVEGEYQDKWRGIFRAVSVCREIRVFRFLKGCWKE